MLNTNGFVPLQASGGSVALQTSVDGDACNV